MRFSVFALDCGRKRGGYSVTEQGLQNKVCRPRYVFIPESFLLRGTIRALRSGGRARAFGLGKLSLLEDICELRALFVIQTRGLLLIHLEGSADVDVVVRAFGKVHSLPLFLREDDVRVHD